MTKEKIPCKIPFKKLFKKLFKKISIKRQYILGALLFFVIFIIPFLLGKSTTPQLNKEAQIKLENKLRDTTLQEILKTVKKTNQNKGEACQVTN